MGGQTDDRYKRKEERKREKEGRKRKELIFVCFIYKLGIGLFLSLAQTGAKSEPGTLILLAFGP